MRHFANALLLDTGEKNYLLMVVSRVPPHPLGLIPEDGDLAPSSMAR